MKTVFGNEAWLPAMAAVMLFAASCGKKENVEDDRMVVLTAKVCEYTESAAERFPFIAKPENETILSFRVSGPLVEFDVDKGDFFREGDIIGRIDDRDYRTRNEKAQAQLTLARNEFERISRLYNMNNVPKSMYDKAESDYRLAEVNAKDAENQLSDCILRAPFDGYVQDVNAERFQDIKASQPVLSLIDISDLKIEISVPSKYALADLDGNSVQIFFDKDKTKCYTPESILLAKGNSSNNISYTLTATIRNDGSMVAGMGGTARISGNGEYTVVAIDQKALCNSPQDGTFVWVKDENGTVKKRSVKTGEMISGGRITISEGLSAGEEVVLSGKNLLAENDKVICRDSTSRI